MIKGIKLRATTDVVEGAGLKLVKKAKEIGREAGLPIAVHIGIDRGEERFKKLMERVKHAKTFSLYFYERL